MTSCKQKTQQALYADAHIREHKQIQDDLAVLYMSLTSIFFLIMTMVLFFCAYVLCIKNEE